MKQGGMWLYDNWARRHSDKSLSYRLLVAWNMAIIVVGTFLMISGVSLTAAVVFDSFADLHRRMARSTASSLATGA